MTRLGLATILLLAAAALALAAGWAWREVDSFLGSPVAGGPAGTNPKAMVVVPRGATFAETLALLTEKGLVANPRAFGWLAAHRGDDQRLKAGDYELSGDWTPAQLLDHLVAGRSRTYKVTVPEGLNLAEVAALLEREGFGSAARFLELARSPEFVGSLALPREAASLEGFLFPETYHFPRSHREEDILTAMVVEFNRRYTLEHAERAAELGLGAYEVVTLASMIEKETGSGQDRGKISRVFHNRIKKRMRLESDPTVIYGIENFDGNLTRAHLRAPAPHNTYTNFGLPPTPIANPGLDSLRAALFPEDGDWLFFVSKGDGGSHFSVTLEEHNRAVRRYQLKRGG